MGEHAEAVADRRLRDPDELRACVEDAARAVRVFDVHTHLFPPEFGPLNLWGIDELLTYHYLVAEFFRCSPMTPEEFWRLTQPERADRIWRALFVENTPLSEAASGVVAVLSAFGLDPCAPDLSEARAFFAGRDAREHVSAVLDLAGVSDVVMTNDPFDEAERRVWEAGGAIDARFHAALRLDPILNAWPQAVPRLSEWGYPCEHRPDAPTFSSVRRFLDDWVGRMRPLYMAVSLPDGFRFPGEEPRQTLLVEVILPACREHGLPMALMIGPRRQVNPRLRMAGDGAGRADLTALERMCKTHHDIRFLVTVLSRENQHDLCVLARKFGNLMPFGCWWFLNNPSVVSEITRERIEMLGISFIPQHSDARVPEQLIYKWKHSRTVIASALYDSYRRLLDDGRCVSAGDVRRDVDRLFSGNFRRWVGS